MAIVEAAVESREGAVPRSAFTMVLVLTLAMTLSYCDRFVINLAIEPIKRDLMLSDSELALVQGFAFSMFFVAFGLPLGVLADRRRRLTLISAGILLWSLATCACGFVTSFGGLLACRIAVAVGEATLSPAAFSIFADILPRRRLGLAVGVFSLGIYLGAGLAFLGGAAILARFAGGVNLPVLGHLHGWRALFLFVGLPGLPVALLVAALREPLRTGAHQDLSIASLARVRAFAGDHSRALALLFLCAGFASLTSQAYAAWMPSFLVRTFGWSISRAGSLSGLAIIGGGLSGVMAAGLAGDALRRRGLRNGRILLMSGSAVAALLPSFGAPLIGDARSALLLMLLSMFLNSLLLTCAAPAVQELVPSRMQGTIIAVYTLTVTIIGLGLGPSAVALITDHLLHDERRVGVAIACTSVLSTCASAIAGLSALRPYAIKLAEREEYASAEDRRKHSRA